MTTQEVLKKQARLKALFLALIQEKQKTEVLTFGRKNGLIVERYPDGTEKVVGYAK